MADAYPLTWPPGWQRTKYVQTSRFGKGYGRQHTIAESRNYLIQELDRLGATKMVLSTNVPVRLDGLPYSNVREPEDSGVAVYFTLNNKEQCIPCDKWDKVADNIWAIAKTIDALRGLERWGAKDMVNAAFRGFQALPDYTSERDPIIPQQDFFIGCRDRLEVKEKYRKLVKIMHPDVGGDTIQFQELNRQYERRMKL